MSLLPKGKGSRGFAKMSPERQREIASKGGKAAHAKGTAHQFTADEAQAAGRKGGESVSKDKAHMAKIGQKGGRRTKKSREVVELFGGILTPTAEEVPAFEDAREVPDGPVD